MQRGSRWQQVASRKVCNASEAPNTECPEDIDIRGNFDGLTRLLRAYSKQGGRPYCKCCVDSGK